MSMSHITGSVRSRDLEEKELSFSTCSGTLLPFWCFTQSFTASFPKLLITRKRCTCIFGRSKYKRRDPSNASRRVEKIWLALGYNTIDPKIESSTHDQFESRKNKYRKESKFGQTIFTSGLPQSEVDNTGTVFRHGLYC